MPSALFRTRFHVSPKESETDDPMQMVKNDKNDENDKNENDDKVVVVDDYEGGASEDEELKTWAKEEKEEDEDPDQRDEYEASGLDNNGIDSDATVNGEDADYSPEKSNIFLDSAESEEEDDDESESEEEEEGFKSSAELAGRNHASSDDLMPGMHKLTQEDPLMEQMAADPLIAQLKPIREIQNPPLYEYVGSALSTTLTYQMIVFVVY